MIKINQHISIDENEIEVKFIRAPGPGGQHVNKVESAVQIRFDAKHSPSINENIFERLRKLSGRRMTNDGVIIITSTATRSQVRNREEAFGRLISLIKNATIIPKARKKTRPSFASKQRHIDSKTRKGNVKKLRSKRITD